jgi:hypothetical protein
MHSYTITAKPNRRQRIMRTVRHFAVRLLITIGLLLLAVAVVVLRCARVLINLAAAAAARAEYAASERAGTPPIGATIGCRLAEAFTDEFNDAYQAAA